jgi:hypothetical protein
MVNKYQITLDNYKKIIINKVGNKSNHNTYTLLGKDRIFNHAIRIYENQNIFYEFIKFQKILNDLHS